VEKSVNLAPHAGFMHTLLQLSSSQTRGSLSSLPDSMLCAPPKGLMGAAALADGEDGDMGAAPLGEAGDAAAVEPFTSDVDTT